ncbi:MAG: protein phosphatase 2C domain-containing protein [Candidatus Vecturithrix sp.]|nr:protein phosphatase 2C domain-containing protein [Candidatus Vecturithrix sp.]
MTIRAVGLTDTGSKRMHNEDALLCDVSAGLFIVADGMGGRAAGETASKAVITLIPLILREKFACCEHPTPDMIVTALHDTLCELSQDLYQQSQSLPEVRGLGSTVAILLFRDHHAYIACAGDSRVYVLRQQQLLQITEDQTIAASLIRTGHLNPEIAKAHPLSHALEEYIGKEDDLHPGIWKNTVQEHDRWLLCSDGLTKGLSEHELFTILLLPSPPGDVCEALISTAKQQDGTDNITAIVVDIVSL